MTEISKKVQNVLSDESENIEFEQIAGEETSPLNAPVIEKDNAGTRSINPEENDTTPQVDESQNVNDKDDILDAPEQQINVDIEDVPDVDESLKESEEFELPTSHAKQAADAFLGMADNLFEIGGGFFVKVKKHSDFFDFDEIIQVIDEQNSKNVKRLRLEKEDKALLKPLLVAVLQKKAKKLSPEKQLMGAAISILLKKFQIVLEVKVENEILVERILEIIREERGITSEEAKDDSKEYDIEEEPNLEFEEVEKSTQTVSPESVLEVAEVGDQDEKGA